MTSEAKSIKREVLDFENAYWEAVRSGDYDTVERLTAGSFTFVQDEGIATFESSEFADMLRGTSFRLLSYSIDKGGASVQRLSPELVLVAYKVQQEYERDGRPERTESYDSSVLRKINGGWERVAHTAS